MGKIKTGLLFCLSLFLFMPGNGHCQNSTQNISNSDQWVATDSLGRTLPTYAECGGYKPNKYVGVFYWFWHGFVRTSPIKDMTKELHNTNGNPTFAYQDWYWGEPEDGYYHSSDPYVLRKNITMLANAGVDFVFIDFTNGGIDWSIIDPFCTTALALKQQGIQVPRIVFFLNTGAKAVMSQLYNDYYSQNKYKDLWFYWDGKPLIMESADSAATQTIKDFFTFRDTWAFQSDQHDQWRFIDDYPQRYSWHTDANTPEQICVSRSMGAPLYTIGSVNNKGSSYTKAKGTPQYDQYMECPRTPYGDFFEEQWSQAHTLNPSIVLVSGWNELTAGAWHGLNGSHMFMKSPVPPAPNDWYMVDEFNVEFNRDIEPVKGYCTDNYYYQMISHIRKYKGMQAPDTASSPKTIAIDGSFGDWSSVTPVFIDPVGDVPQRNWRNVDNSANYVNTTGRNDMVESRVTYDNTYVYYYVKTVQTITAYTDPNWMLLFIDVDKNKATGWEGYDYVINNGVNSALQTTVKHWDGTS